jgi:RNA polymerase sigma-70 factor (ECF subfamily)
VTNTDNSDGTSDFVQLITEYQPRLYGYILALAGNPDAANDVLQDVNIVLWKQSAQFTLGSNFKAWSFRIAHFQYMAYRQKRLRDKVLFSNELISTLATEAKRVDELYEQRKVMLERCLELMPERSREVIRLRYADDLNVEQMSEKLRRNSNAIYQILFRARRWLIECVRQEALPRAT